MRGVSTVRTPRQDGRGPSEWRSYTRLTELLTAFCTLCRCRRRRVRCSGFETGAPCEACAVSCSPLPSLAQGASSPRHPSRDDLHRRRRQVRLRCDLADAGLQTSSSPSPCAFVHTFVPSESPLPNQPCRLEQRPRDGKVRLHSLISADGRRIRLTFPTRPRRPRPPPLVWESPNEHIQKCTPTTRSRQKAVENANDGETGQEREPAPPCPKRRRLREKTPPDLDARDHATTAFHEGPSKPFRGAKSKRLARSEPVRPARHFPASSPAFHSPPHLVVYSSQSTSLVTVSAWKEQTRQVVSVQQPLFVLQVPSERPGLTSALVAAHPASLFLPPATSPTSALPTRRSRSHLPTPLRISTPSPIARPTCARKPPARPPSQHRPRPQPRPGRASSGSANTVPAPARAARRASPIRPRAPKPQNTSITQHQRSDTDTRPVPYLAASALAFAYLIPSRVRVVHQPLQPKHRDSTVYVMHRAV